jgi:hypothetical protein
MYRNKLPFPFNKSCKVLLEISDMHCVVYTIGFLCFVYAWPGKHVDLPFDQGPKTVPSCLCHYGKREYGSIHPVSNAVPFPLDLTSRLAYATTAISEYDPNSFLEGLKKTVENTANSMPEF